MCLLFLKFVRNYVWFVKLLDIYLASASPRRKEILENINLPIEILPSDVDENLDKEAFKATNNFSLYWCIDYKS